MVAQARHAAAGDGDDREIVAGLVHGLSVLQAFQRKPRLTQSELSAMTGLTRATARRSLITLTSLGYVETERAVLGSSSKYEANVGASGTLIAACAYAPRIRLESVMPICEAPT